MLPGGDDRAGLADLDRALAVGAGEGPVLAHLDAGVAHELADVVLVGVAHDVARHGPGGVGAPGALVRLDPVDGQGVDPAPGVRGDGLGDDEYYEFQP